MSTEKTRLLVEERCYRQIAAPRGVAPRTKRPFTMTSEMQAHHWVNFSKVYGPYLISHCMPEPPKTKYVRAATQVLEVVKKSLLSSVSNATVQQLREDIRELAEGFDDAFPNEFKVMMLHLLMFHLPDTIDYWGPARGYWNFPYERSVQQFQTMSDIVGQWLTSSSLLLRRNIGKLARTIKSRSEPEENLVNRYLLAAGVTHTNAFVEIDAEEAEEEDAHPLVPLGAVNSTSNRAVQNTVWPILTKRNSRFLHADSDRPLAHRSKVPERILQQYVGVDAIQRNQRVAHHFKARGTYNAVHIGPWKFTTIPASEVTTPRTGTNHSYFAIRAKHIVHEFEYMRKLEETEEGRAEKRSIGYDPEELIFGQFHRFIQLNIPFWSKEDSEHRLGQCTLWRPLHWNRPAADGLPHHFKRTGQPAIIDLRQSNVLVRNRQGALVQVKYVPLKHIETIVAIAPMITSLVDENEERIYYAAMPLTV